MKNVQFAWFVDPIYSLYKEHENRACHVFYLSTGQKERPCAFSAKKRCKKIQTCLGRFRILHHGVPGDLPYRPFIPTTVPTTVSAIVSGVHRLPTTTPTLRRLLQ